MILLGSERLLLHGEQPIFVVYLSRMSRGLINHPFTGFISA